MNDQAKRATVIIVGANGRFGRAALTAFHDAGWHIKAFARSRPAAGAPRMTGVEYIAGNAMNGAELAKACVGADVIVNALNPPYPAWKRMLPNLTANVLAAAKASGATVMIPGNVYNYGATMPAVLTEITPHHAATQKGKLRIAMERSYADAAQDGVQTIIVRGGDFIEQAQTGNWFDSHIANKTHQGIITYPGHRDAVHAWAYLPDMARAMVQLAERREELAPFDEFGFEGFNLTGNELIGKLEGVTGRTLKVKTIPWPLMKLLGLFAPTIREVMEMRYLWDVPHAMDGSKLRAALPGFEATPVDVALRDAIAVSPDKAMPRSQSASRPVAA
ncbi:MAG: NAD(P)H-binding protein [Pseudomonadota bacterium]